MSPERGTRFRLAPDAASAGPPIPEQPLRGIGRILFRILNFVGG